MERKVRQRIGPVGLGFLRYYTWTGRKRESFHLKSSVMGIIILKGSGCCWTIDYELRCVVRCFCFKRILCARLGFLRVVDWDVSEVEAGSVSWWIDSRLFVLWIWCWLFIKLSWSCSSWSSVIGLGTLAALLETGERMGVMSVCEEFEVQFTTCVGVGFDWNSGCENFRDMAWTVKVDRVGQLLGFSNVS